MADLLQGSQGGFDSLTRYQANNEGPRGVSSHPKSEQGSELRLEGLLATLLKDGYIKDKALGGPLVWGTSVGGIIPHILDYRG